jgi:hypothetical protein
MLIITAGMAAKIKMRWMSNALTTTQDIMFYQCATLDARAVFGHPHQIRMAIMAKALTQWARLEAKKAKVFSEEIHKSIFFLLFRLA